MIYEQFEQELIAKYGEKIRPFALWHYCSLRHSGELREALNAHKATQELHDAVWATIHRYVNSMMRKLDVMIPGITDAELESLNEDLKAWAGRLAQDTH